MAPAAAPATNSWIQSPLRGASTPAIRFGDQQCCHWTKGTWINGNLVLSHINVKISSHICDLSRKAVKYLRVNLLIGVWDVELCVLSVWAQPNIYLLTAVVAEKSPKIDIGSSLRYTAR